MKSLFQIFKLRSFNSPQDRRITFMLAALLLVPSLNFYANYYVQYVFGQQSISVVSYLVLALIGIFSYKYLFTSSSKLLIIVTLAALFGAVLSYLLYPSIRLTLLLPDFNPIESGMLMLGFYCVPALLLGYNNKNWTFIRLAFYYLAFFVIPSSLYFYNAYYIGISLIDRVDYMTYSYNVLPYTCACLYEGFTNKKKMGILVGLVGVIEIFAVGARGALACALLFALLVTFTNSSLKLKFFSACVALTIYLNLTKVLLWFSNLFDSFHVYSRTLSLMLNNEFDTSNSREMIRNALLEKVLDCPMGYGLFGDRYIASVSASNSLTSSTYAHNLAVEFICDFGLIGGPLLLMWYLWRISKSMSIRIEDRSIHFAVLLLVVCGFANLFMSGSYLASIMFWTLTGLLIRLRRFKQN